MGQRTAYGNNIEHLDRVLSELVQEHHQDGHEKVVISAGGLAAHVEKLGRAAIYSAGYGSWWEQQYESIEWVKWDGLHIDAEQYLEERAERLDNQEADHER